MKNNVLVYSLSIVIFALSGILFVSCGSDDEEDSNRGISVVIKENGTTSNGSIFSAVDDKNFYLDYVKYSVKEGHLAVTGYDKSGFKGVAKIVSSITYNGNFFEVLEIGDQAFKNCEILTSVSIPKCVTAIGDYAFYGCI